MFWHDELAGHGLHFGIGSLLVYLALQLSIRSLQRFSHAQVVKRHSEPALGHLLVLSGKHARVKAHEVLVLQLSEVTRLKHGLLIVRRRLYLLFDYTQLPETTLWVHRQALSPREQQIRSQRLQHGHKAAFKRVLAGATYPGYLDHLRGLIDVLHERRVPLSTRDTVAFTDMADARDLAKPLRCLISLEFNLVRARDYLLL